MTKYNVSEIFYTLQGEGPHVGSPVIFVRFSGCNLRCQWANSICDTPYASWAPEVKMMTIQELIEQIDRLSDINRCRYVIFTGGEPTIQNLDPVCDILQKKGYTMGLETNGTGKIPTQIHYVVCSPKLSDSVPDREPERTMHERHRGKVKPNILAWQKATRSEVFLKFVVSPGNTSMKEIRALCKDIGTYVDRIFLMPEGLTPERILKNQLPVAELAKKHGFCFSTRLHILLWGNQRAT